MIRREPTLIPMTDEDVQDVRAVVAKQKLADTPSLTKEDVEMFDSLKDGISKAERLGLDSDAGMFFHHYLSLTIC
jgi:hypothetical protein